MIASSSAESGEQCILTLAASLGASIPVDLRDATTGLGERNIQRLLTAIQHAPGKRPEQRTLMIVLSSEKAGKNESSAWQLASATACQ